MPYESHWFTTKDGVRMHYIDEGAGVPVVIVSGLLGWSFQFRNLVRYLLDDRHRVVVIDHVGFGLSDKPENYDYCLDAHIENLAEILMKHLQLPRFHLITHGMGGPVAIGFAVNHSDRLRRFVMLNCPSFPGVPFMPWLWMKRIPGLWKLRFGNSLSYIRKHLNEGTALPLPEPVVDGYLGPYLKPEDRIPWEKSMECFQEIRANYSYVRINEIALQMRLIDAIPTMIVGGEKDTIFYPQSHLRWQHVLPNALVLSFPKVGHYLLEDSPEEIIPMVGNFLG